MKQRKFYQKLAKNCKFSQRTLKFHQNTRNAEFPSIDHGNMREFRRKISERKRENCLKNANIVKKKDKYCFIDILRIALISLKIKPSLTHFI